MQYTYRTNGDVELVIPGFGVTVNGQITSDQPIENPNLVLVTSEQPQTAPQTAPGYINGVVEPTTQPTPAPVAAPVIATPEIAPLQSVTVGATASTESETA